MNLNTGKGGVTWEEFLDLMTGRRQTQSLQDEMRDIFKIFDADDDGYINAADIERTMKSLGEDVTEEDVLHMVREADEDGDNLINFRGRS